MPSNMPPDVSPLAQRLADVYEIDFVILGEKYPEKITARNVPCHLHTAGDRASPKRQRKPAAPSQSSDISEVQQVDKKESQLCRNI